jgi:hypothetical protein
VGFTEAKLHYDVTKKLVAIALFFTSALSRAEAAPVQLDCPVRATYCVSQELCLDFDDELVLDASRHVVTVHVRRNGQEFSDPKDYTFSGSGPEIKFGGWTLNQSTLHLSHDVDEHGALQYAYEGECTRE